MTLGHGVGMFYTWWLVYVFAMQTSVALVVKSTGWRLDLGRVGVVLFMSMYVYHRGDSLT